MTPSVRVLACGSIDRGDDGVALRVVRALSQFVRREASIEAVGYLSPELLMGDPPNMRRLVVDCVAGLPCGEILDLPLADLPALEAQMGTTSSHALAPGAAVALADLLGCVRPTDRFLGIGGESFAVGDDLSPAVVSQIAALAERLNERIGEAVACA
jgi:hydrogenase maturation protease